jgi:pimeloyl-ACP methyl ester carboxylesterase
MALITLSDGRYLAYAEYGDSAGKPLFFFHGTPGSRFFHPPLEITIQLGVRLICIDRPGYGESTFQPGRCILDWPLDIVQFADALKIDKFFVAGHSGGGPYTLACAYSLPERVIRAVTLSGAGLVDVPDATRGMTWINRLGFKFSRYLPWNLQRLIVWFIYREKCADPVQAMARQDGHRPLADDKLLAIPEIRQLCLESEVEAYRPGMIGFAWDIRLITRPWGFRCEKIHIPVFLWHGTADNMTSLPMAHHLAGSIPGCKATICENEAHLLLFPHWKDILTQLTSG